MSATEIHALSPEDFEVSLCKAKEYSRSQNYEYEKTLKEVQDQIILEVLQGKHTTTFVCNAHIAMRTVLLNDLNEHYGVDAYEKPMRTDGSTTIRIDF